MTAPSNAKEVKREFLVLFESPSEKKSSKKGHGTKTHCRSCFDGVITRFLYIIYSQFSLAKDP